MSSGEEILAREMHPKIFAALVSASTTATTKDLYDKATKMTAEYVELHFSGDKDA